jgi:hypothetical protein
MTSPVQLVLTVAPLAFYFYIVALLQAGRHPRVVAGALDVTLLTLGVGGLIIFGPFGHLLVGMLFGQPGPIPWLMLILGAILVVATLARRSTRRLVIYHIDAETLESVLPDALGPGPFVRTVDGFEDRTQARGVRVESSPRWQSAVIEAYGRNPNALIRELGPRLRDRLRGVPTRTSEVAVILFGLSALTMLVPLTGYLLAQPHARAALRVLLEHLKGG